MTKRVKHLLRTQDLLQGRWELGLRQLPQTVHLGNLLQPLDLHHLVVCQWHAHLLELYL